ncbi:MAG: hypothetical protein L6265_09885 [Thermoplasmatales archaeon]|nr:hypothetical protein [Thermoplasmatales archaeon]
MNKKIMKVVLAIAVVFCFAAMPISGMIGNPITGMVRADDAVGVVRNVPPTAHQQTTTTGGDDVVYNSGSDTLQFQARIIDRNREDDIGNVGDVLDSGGGVAANRYSWLNISRVGANYANYTCIVDSSPGAGQVELFNYTTGYTATDGILCLSGDDSNPYFVWTCPSTWAIGYYWANLSIADSDGNRCNFNAFQFECKSAIKTIGIYNYTGLAVDIATPYFWNFTTTDPGVLNVTSGNWSYPSGTGTPATNYDYDNATGRLWSYWIIVNNSGGGTSQCFNISFGATGFTSASKPGTPITTGNVIRFEYYRTGNRTYEGASTAGTNSNASWVTANEPSNLTYVKDGVSPDITSNDGMYMFQFDAAVQNIWVRYMIDIPDPCRPSTEYTRAYTVTA